MAFFRRRRGADPAPAPEDLSVPVDPECLATFLVATSDPPDDPGAAARARVDDRWAFVPAMFDAGALHVSVHRVDDPEGPPIPPADLLAAFRPAPELLERYEQASVVLAVQADGRPGWPPLHEWAARAVAAELAGDGDPIVDLVHPRLIDRDEATAVLPSDDTPFVLQRWIQIPHSAGAAGHWLTTSGLVRFGLPEIQVRDVPPHLPGPLSHVVNGLAQVLLGMLFHRDADELAPLTVPGSTVDVSLRDIALAATGTAPDDDEENVSVTVALRLEEDPDGGDRFLTVLAPPGVAAVHGVFLDTICGALFGNVDHDVVVPVDQERMDRLIAQARAELPAVRARFLSGLPLGHELLVKWRLAVDGGAEYPWAFVTAWETPEALTATSASDAHGDPAVRAGTIVTLPSDDLVDWAIWHGGEIVEGHGTAQAL